MWRSPHRHTTPNGRSRGQSLVELALILPIFLLLIAGAVDLGRLFYAYVAIVDASKEGALFGATNPQCGTGAECGDPMNVVWHVRSEAGGLKDAAGNQLTPTVSCLSSGSAKAARAALSGCQDGDTYRVGLSYDFRLITPILGNLLENRLILHAEADATVLNQPYDPIPGVSVTKEVKDPETDKWVRSPAVDPKTGLPSNLEFHVTDDVDYRITLRNTGATSLSGIAITDDAFKKWSDTRCPSFASLAVGEVRSCSYPVHLTKVQKNLTNTVTVTVPGLSPVVDVAIIDVLASPAQLVVSKTVSPYRNSQASDRSHDLTVSRSAKIDPTVWYRLVVTNTGGSPATKLQIDDSAGQLPVTGDCPRPPASLDPDRAWICYYPDTIDRPGKSSNTLTADSRETIGQTDTTRIEVQTCKGQDLVVPNLVEDQNGDVRRMSDARKAWTAAGFDTPLTTSGRGNPDVASQRPADPFECASPTIHETVDD
jgi:TadE-like protein